MMAPQPQRKVAVVLTAWDSHGEIIDIIDIPADSSRETILWQRQQTKSKPGVHRVTVNDVFEDIKQ